jgi:hypothetical protein
MKSKKGRTFDANLLLNLKGKWLTEFKFAPREKAPGAPKKRVFGKKMPAKKSAKVAAE